LQALRGFSRPIKSDCKAKDESGLAPGKEYDAAVKEKDRKACSVF